ncbi:hypothetical protein FACS1894187_11240 [Synergistales bacterium]|nr:hypothetical protein FACS1894187_11240 [Synergistales bacterium]
MENGLISKLQEIYDWQLKHQNVIIDFLQYTNSKTSNLILKGGTALAMCYELDRFSEDIDFDGRKHEDGANNTVGNIVDNFCKSNNFTYRVAKDTEFVKRYMIHYEDDISKKPLKIETSYRKKEVFEDEVTKVNGIMVYKVEPLLIMKVNAYSDRDKIRDLYDLVYIYNNFAEQASPQSLSFLRNAFEYKGIEHVDYILKTQSDLLINNEKLSGDFLEMYSNLGLLYEKHEPKRSFKNVWSQDEKSREFSR